MSPNVGFTRSFGGALCQLFNTVKAYSAAKICPKCLPEPANAGPLAGGRRASLARRAEHPRSHGTAGSAAGKFCCAKMSGRQYSCQSTLIFFEPVLNPNACSKLTRSALGNTLLSAFNKNFSISKYSTSELLKIISCIGLK